MDNYITLENGLLLDPDTGEVVGDSKIKDGFVVNDQATLEWALERRLAITTGIDAKKRYYDMIAEQGRKELKRLQNQLDYWQWRHGADVEHYTRDQLNGKKQRFISTAYGDVCLRKTHIKVEVTDHSRAVEWMINNNLYELADQAFTINMKQVKKVAEKPDNILPTDLFKITPPSDNFAIRLPNIAETEED